MRYKDMQIPRSRSSEFSIFCQDIRTIMAQTNSCAALIAKKHVLKTIWSRFEIIIGQTAIISTKLINLAQQGNKFRIGVFMVQTTAHDKRKTNSSKLDNFTFDVIIGECRNEPRNAQEELFSFDQLCGRAFRSLIGSITAFQSINWRAILCLPAKHSIY